MKKITVLVLIFLFLISSGVMAQQRGYFEVKLGLETFGNQEYSDPTVSNYDDDVDAGISLTGEYKVPLNNSQWTLGGGINHQFGRSIDFSGSEDFNFTSFYGLAQYNLVDNPIYLLGKLGYNTYNNDNFTSVVDENGGLYYGLGAGYNFGKNNQYVFEALYSLNSGEAEAPNGDTAEFDYSSIALSLGIKF